MSVIMIMDMTMLMFMLIFSMLMLMSVIMRVLVAMTVIIVMIVGSHNFQLLHKLKSSNETCRLLSRQQKLIIV